MTKVTIIDEAFADELGSPVVAQSKLQEMSRFSPKGCIRGRPPVRSVEDLRHFSNLERFKLVAACVDDYSPLGHLKHLEYLTIEITNFSASEALDGLDELVYCTLEWNFIQDLTPLLELPRLKLLQVHGNPLDRRSYYEVIPQLEDNDVTVHYDDEETWKFQRWMWEQGHRACFGRVGTLGERYDLVVPELCCRLEEKFRVERIDPEILREELEQDGADIEEIAQRHRSRPYRREDFTERGDAEQAHQWIDAAEVPADSKEVMHRFVDEHVNLTFVREKARVFKELSRRLYYWKPYPKPEGLQPPTPDWFCAHKEALSYLLVGEEDGVLNFGDDVLEPLQDTPVALRPVGVRGNIARRALSDRWKFLPIAYGGERAELALGINLQDPSDHTIYLTDLDGVHRWDFNPYDTEAFEHLAEFFEAVDQVVAATEVGGAIAGLADEPPSVGHLDIEEHRRVTDADEIKERLADAQFDEEIAASIERLVDAFPDAVFLREDEELIEYWEVSNQRRFPDWYRQVRQVVAGPILPKTKIHHTQVRLSKLDKSPTRDDAVCLFPPVVPLKDFRHILVDECGAVPIAHAPYRMLVIRADGDDRSIYEFDPTLVEKSDFNPFDRAVFSGPADFFDSIDAVATSVGDEKMLRDER